MNADHRATALRFHDDPMLVELDDGGTLGLPLAWPNGLALSTPAPHWRLEEQGVLGRDGA